MTTVKMVKLGTLIKPAKLQKCGNDDYPVLSMTMHNGLVFQSDKFKKSVASQDKSTYKVVHRNQLVIGFPIDEGVLATQRIIDAGIVSPAYGIWDVDQTKIIPEFLEYALRCNRAIDYYKAKLRGSTARRRSLPTPTLLELDVPLPDIEQQKLALTTIHHAKNALDSRQAQLTKLDELVKARFVEMFGDVISNSNLWPICKFSEITSSRLGKMLDAKQQTGVHRYPYLANFNVQWFRFELKTLNSMDFNESDRIEFELHDGDLLVCEGGEIGRCAVWHNNVQPCYFQKALHRVRCNKDFILPDFLAWWFKYNCDHGGFSAIEGAKATIAHLPGAKLKNLDVCVPPLPLQNQFATFVEEVDKSKLFAELFAQNACILAENRSK